MSFFKKLVKGIGSVAKGIGKGLTSAVSKVTGFASKILPGPLGDAAKGVSKITGFASKLLSGSSGNTGIVLNQKAASQAVLPSPTSTYVAPVSLEEDIKEYLGGGSWFKKYGMWVVTGIGFLITIVVLIVNRKK